MPLRLNRPPLNDHLLHINKNTVSINTITNHLIVHSLYIDRVYRPVSKKHALIPPGICLFHAMTIVIYMTL